MCDENTHKGRVITILIAKVTYQQYRHTHTYSTVRVAFSAIHIHIAI
jgi:hypothetical protein